jgi:hypothetical protein
MLVNFSFFYIIWKRLFLFCDLFNFCFLLKKISFETKRAEKTELKKLFKLINLFIFY